MFDDEMEESNVNQPIELDDSMLTEPSAGRAEKEARDATHTHLGVSLEDCNSGYHV